MSLDINKVAIKTSLTSCFGKNFYELEGAEEFLQAMADHAEEISLSAQEYIFREKDSSDYVYIPISGVIMLERSTQKGSRHVFAFLFTGNISGISEYAVYSFGAKALTDATVVKISKQLINEFFENYQQFAQRLHEQTNHILTNILDQLFIMGQRSAHQRLAHFLMDMQYRIGHGTNTFFLPMSRQDIADYLGMSLETASRGFSSLKNKGMISIESNYQITVLDEEQLKEYAEG